MQEDNEKKKKKPKKNNNNKTEINDKVIIQIMKNYFSHLVSS